jgi:protein involved in polysaccharide export with SLBB domain
VALLASSAGCTAFMEPRSDYPITPPPPSPQSLVPRELDMVSLPPYIIEPPDILMINAVKVIPKPPHKIDPSDGLIIRTTDQSLDNAYVVDPEGKVDLGPTYGKVSVKGLTTDEARDAIRRHLAQKFEGIEVSVSLALFAGAQPIQGEHLVGPDGRVNLGTYGMVYVAGRTIEEARTAIETQLSNYLDDPQVVVDVFAYNSKKYYIVTQGAGYGDNLTAAPITGNETVMDAISLVGGLSQFSSTRIWIARPAPNGGCEQILPVNWADISRGASTATNYQLLPGDRLYLAEDPVLKFDSLVLKYTRPFERLFGTTALGVNLGNRIKRYGLANF